MTGRAPQSATDLAAFVGTRSVEAVLHEAGIVPTTAGKQRWRDELSRPIPPEALAEGQRWVDEGHAEAHGAAA